MADIDTINYHWTKPENGASAGTWGEKWNTNLDGIDAKLKIVEIKADDAQEDADASLKTANALSELGDSASAARGNIGAQASHANLTAFAGLAGASGKTPYFTGAGTLALFDTTSFGREIGNVADAAAMRTKAGLRIGTAAVAVSQSGPSGGADGDVWVVVP